MKGRNRSQRRKPTSASIQIEQLKFLKQIAVNESNELMEPKVPDVLPMTLKRNKVFTFSRTRFEDLVLSGSTDSNQRHYTFPLNSFVNSTDFTNLYDQYRIAEVQLRYIPIYGPSDFPGVIYSAIDVDDANDEVINQIIQNETVMVTPLYQPFVRTLHPLVALPVFEEGSITDKYATGIPNQWIDAASPGVTYYGVKLSAPVIAGAPANITVGQIICTAIIQCRNPR
jgi:hypothetical protein